MVFLRGVCLRDVVSDDWILPHETVQVTFPSPGCIPPSLSPSYTLTWTVNWQPSHGRFSNVTSPPVCQAPREDAEGICPKRQRLMHAVRACDVRGGQPWCCTSLRWVPWLSSTGVMPSTILSPLYLGLLCMQRRDGPFSAAGRIEIQHFIHLQIGMP